MSRLCLILLATIVVTQQANGAAIPIWELLTHEEKMGRLFYVFVHLVEQYCKTSDIPDCPKVLTLYGMSNLVSESDHSLDLMDPYQRDAKTIVWERIMRGEFKLPTKLPGKPVKPPPKAVLNNDVYSSPYEVRVRPPSTYVAPASGQFKVSNEATSNVSDDTEGNSSKLTIIRIGRSLADSGNDLPLLSEQDAHELSSRFDV